MKNIIIKISVITVALLMAACVNDNLPKANFSLYQVEKVTAVGGDESAVVSWTLQDGKALPLDFLLTWTAGSTAGEDGEMTVDASKREVTIDHLANDCSYTFGVQARYEDGLAMKITAKCTPKSTRIPASGFKAMAGDARAFVSWTAPETNLAFNYRLKIESAKGSKDVEIESTAKSYLVNELVNGTDYTFYLTCVYGHGESPTVSATATPGEIDPIVGPASLYPYQLGKFEYNPAYFVSGTIASVEWNFGDGTVATNESPVHCFADSGTYTIVLTVTYESGTTENASFNVTVGSFAWGSASGVGYQKSSNVVFSLDGQTLYTIPQTDKKILAISAITGETLWEYGTSAATYGAGPAVGSDGKIYFGTEDADGSFFALSPAGALKWKKSLGAAVKASPAVTSDGVVYALADGGKFYALDAETGTEKWSVVQAGNAAGVAVDAEGNVYFATGSGIWSYSSTGNLRWSCAEALSVTERGGSLAIHDGILYAALKGKAGCAAVSLADGSVIWKYATTKGDCYHPVVDGEGTVYFCEKAGYLYAVKKDGTLKWKDTANANYIYNGFAIGENGNVYISQYASPFKLLSFDSAGTRSEIHDITAQTMSPISIGPDRRIYYMTNGTLSAFDAKVGISAAGWPARGGNQQGTNSLR